MGINETMTEFVNQGLQEINVIQLDFGLKILIILGFLYLLNMVFKTGGSLIEILIYLIGFIKYIIYKIKKKDI